MIQIALISTLSVIFAIGLNDLKNVIVHSPPKKTNQIIFLTIYLIVVGSVIWLII